MNRFCQALKTTIWKRISLLSLQIRAGNTNVNMKPQLNDSQNVEQKLQVDELEKSSFQPSERYLKFQEKLRSDAPLADLPQGAAHPAHEKEPLQPWPNNTNPHTGEIGGPAGPEPTRYGDWERKGRVTDF
ncbi:succinate dehydrogenase assembly factor 4, mitochondrial [Drosophila tropicalis]|uniref:succinate dehydrogenase assembly factor 4, mitochondrial n=1 Tax=Drosophila tropicalis TaxID=46794 RepID=UPI0035AB8AD4